MKFIALEKLNLSISYIKDWILTYIDRFTAKLSPIKLREVLKFPFEVVPDLGEWFASPMTGIEILDHFPTLEDVSLGNSKALHLVFTDKTKFPEYIYILGSSLYEPGVWHTITPVVNILENTFNYAYFHPKAINMTCGDSIYVVETEHAFDCFIYIPVSGYASLYTPYLVFSHTPDKFDPEAVKFRLNDEGVIDIDRSNITTEYDEVITNKSIYSKFNIFANSDKLYIKNVGNFDGTNQRNTDVISVTEILNESKEFLDSIPTIIDHPYPFYVVDGLGDWKVNPFGSNTILSSFPNNDSSNSGKVLHLIFTDKSRVPKCMYVVYRLSRSSNYSLLSAINLIDYSYTDPTKHNNTDTLWICRNSTNVYMAECEDCFDALLLLPSGPWNSYGSAMYIIFSETALLNDDNCTAMLLNALGTIDYVGRPTYIKDNIVTLSMLSNIIDLDALTNSEKLLLETYYKLPTIEVWINRIMSKRKTIYDNALITMEICSTENLKHYPFSFFLYMARTGDYPTITVDVSEEIEYQWLDGESTSPVQGRYMWRTYFDLDSTASDVSHTFRPLEFIQIDGITYRIIYKGLNEYNTRESYIYKKAEILDIDTETNKPANCITYSEIENRLISADILKGVVNEVELNLKLNSLEINPSDYISKTDNGSISIGTNVTVTSKDSIGAGAGAYITADRVFGFGTALNTIYLTGSDKTYSAQIGSSTTWTVHNAIAKAFCITNVNSYILDSTTFENVAKIVSATYNGASKEITITLDTDLGTISKTKYNLPNVFAGQRSFCFGSGSNTGQYSNVVGTYNFNISNYSNLIGYRNVNLGGTYNSIYGATNTIEGGQGQAIVGYGNEQHGTGNYNSVVGALNIIDNNRPQAILGFDNKVQGNTQAYLLGYSNTLNSTNPDRTAVVYAMGTGLNSYNSGVVLGQYNKDYETSLTKDANWFAIGKGSESTRLNIIEQKYNGDLYIDGIGGFDGSNSTEENVKPLQEVINSFSGGSGNGVKYEYNEETNTLNITGDSTLMEFDEINLTLNITI